MASWLLGLSKLKNDNLNTNESNDTQGTTNPGSEKSTSTAPPQLLYDLQPTKPKIPDQTEKPFSMLDNIPFVILDQINISNTNCNLEDIQKYLSSIKENLESGVYNYDFSNDRKVLNK